MDDPTQTAPQSSTRSSTDTRAWKLIPLFSGTVGVLAPKPKFWDGLSSLVIGRRTATERLGPCLLLDDERVSREHAQLLAQGEAVFVKDLDSKNGTELNGRRLRPGALSQLGDGDLLRVGDSLVLIRHELALPGDSPAPELLGLSLAMCQVRGALARCAGSPLPVLLLGETGSGKGAAAQALHRLGGRGKLVSVNCAAIPASLAEGLLFGTRKGAFTGAVDRAGFFGEAQGGTLFLDEIGELPMEIQAKLLHAIEAREVVPVGSTRPVSCDVRIVAATNRDLESAIAKQSFREDLFARLSAMTVRLPPVCERREDVLQLAQHMADGKLKLSVQVASALVRYHWPRNVREVGNVINQLLIGLEKDVLNMLEKPDGASQMTPAGKTAAPGQREVAELLARFEGNLQRIEREAGYSRRQFRRWAEQYGLSVDSYRRKQNGS